MIFLKWRNGNRRVDRRTVFGSLRRGLLDWFKLIGMLCVLVTTLSGLTFLLVSSPSLKLEEVEIEGLLEHVTQDDILKTAQLPLGQNLLLMRLAPIKRRIKRQLWVDQVHIRRVYPNKIIIKLEEYKPMALLETTLIGNSGNKGVRTYTIDKKGTIFSELTGKGIPPLPKITGFNEVSLRQFPRYYEKQLKGAFQYLSVLKKKVSPFSLRIDEVEYESKKGLKVLMSFNQPDKVEAKLGSLGRKPLVIYFSGEGIARDMNQWDRLMEVIANEPWRFSQLDLRVEGKVFARSHSS